MNKKTKRAKKSQIPQFYLTLCSLVTRNKTIKIVIISIKL